MTPGAARGYVPGVPGRIPLAAQRLLIVTGKGGVGKSTVAAALARETLAAVAAMRGVEAEQLAAQVEANAARAFALP